MAEEGRKDRWEERKKIGETGIGERERKEER